MNTRRPKVKKVILQQPPGEDICHNKLCRRRMVGPNKNVHFGDGYVAVVCLHCFDLIGQRKWKRA